MVPVWLHRLLNRCASPVAPATPFVLELTGRGQPVLAGRDAGAALRRSSGLDRLPMTTPVVIRRSDTVYAVTSSFWMGLLADRMRASGSVTTFHARHQLQLPPLDRDVLDVCVLRALVTPPHRSVMGRWMRLA